MSIIKIFLFLIMLFTLSTYVSAAWTDGAVVYTPLDDLGTAVTDSLSHFSGTATSASIFNTGTSCVIGGCANFTAANNQIAFGNIGELKRYTISAWVKGISLCTSGASEIINYEPITIKKWHSNSAYQCAVSTQVGGTYYPAKYSNTNLNYTQWYHIVAVYDGENLLAYRDGNLITNNSAPSGDSAFGTALFYNSGGGASYGAVVLDEVGIWNRSLSTTEILQLYNNGTGYNPFPSPARYSIRGQINYSSTPINNSKVLLISPTNSTLIASTTTNSLGQYTFNGSFYPQITNNSLWIVQSYFYNASVYYSGAVFVNVTVAD